MLIAAKIFLRNINWFYANLGKSAIELAALGVFPIIFSDVYALCLNFILNRN